MGLLKQAMLQFLCLSGVFLQASEALSAPATGLKFLSSEQLRAIPLAELPYGGFQMPEKVDLSVHMPPPGHQENQNSCVAWVSAYAVKTYQEKLEQRYRLISRGQPDWEHIFSPAFVYNQINQGRDGGATLVDALNVLSSRGALSWAEMPYNPDDFMLLPTAQQLQAARRFRISYWRQVNPLDPMEMKAQLQAGYPVMIGALIDDGLYNLQPGKVWSHKTGASRGGHAMVVVGYDDVREAFKVLNSWGGKWADKGYGWIDYRHFNRVVREAYVAKDAFNTVGPQAPTSITEGLNRASDLVAGLTKTPKEPLIQSEELALPMLRLTSQKAEHLNLNFAGVAALNPEQGQSMRVLIKFYLDAEGQQPLYLSASFYKLPNAQGIAIGDEQAVQEVVHWNAKIPMDQIPTGIQRLWAQPVLYLDDFGIQTGPLVPVNIPS